MSAFVFAIALLSLLKNGNATNNAAECPPSCSCIFTSSLTKLRIDCVHTAPDTDEEQLLRQIDSLLSEEHVVERLTSLIIVNTPLKRVPASVCQLLNLTKLSIEHNRITQLPDNCFSKLTQLVTLSLKWNSITGLQDGLFDGLQSLQTLRLSHNQISYIGLRLFSNASDLTSLRWLDLNENKLTSLEPWWYYRCILGNETSLVKIHLSWNRISNFTNELQFDFRCDMPRPTGYLDLSFNQITHIMDILQGWNIADLAETAACLSNFRRHSPLMKYRPTFADCCTLPLRKSTMVFPWKTYVVYMEGHGVPWEYHM